MDLTRREFLGRAASAAFVSGGFYRFIDHIARPPVRRLESPGERPVTGALPLEQHLLQGLSTVTDNGSLVTVPPRHHTVVTARLTCPAKTLALQEAQQVLESVIGEMEDSGLLDFRPSGLGLVVAWGLPYFRLLPTALTSAWLPVDIALSQANQATTLAILDAITFASDPPETILEQNDVVFVFASDHLDHIESAFDAIFKGSPGSLMTITSIRRGFVGGHKVSPGGQSLTKRMAVEARIPGAASIPDRAELFLGFTSTQQAALGPSVIANLETLPGLTNQWPNGYFRDGTTMHLSHIYEDLVGWYGNTYRQRAGFAFSPTAGGTVKRGSLTIPEGPADVDTFSQIQTDFKTYGFTGHSSSMQPASRLPAPVTDNYGNIWPAGTAIPQRADFNTLDNPFFFSADPQGDRMGAGHAAGVHFVAFMPTSNSFNRLRQAMDGQYGTGVELGSGAVHSPFNNVLRTTHRQNFLVPPRAHRSFPLAELLT